MPNLAGMAHLDAVMTVVEHAHEIPGEGVRLCVHGLVPCPAHHLLRPQQVHCTWAQQPLNLTGNPVTTACAYLQACPLCFHLQVAEPPAHQQMHVSSRNQMAGRS